MNMVPEGLTSAAVYIRHDYATEMLNAAQGLKQFLISISV